MAQWHWENDMVTFEDVMGAEFDNHYLSENMEDLEDCYHMGAYM